MKSNSFQTFTKCNIEFIHGDLFSMSELSSSLVHSVSADFFLGSGIAVTMKECFIKERIWELRRRHYNIGDVVAVRHRNRYVFNLVVKELYFLKPSYFTLRKSLQTLKKNLIKLNVKHLSMPKISCGLDKLDFNFVLKILYQTFADTDIRISIFYL